MAWSSVVFQTVISGVLVFLLGEILQRFVLEPLREFKTIVARIDNRLHFYSNRIVNPPGNKESISEWYKEASNALRELSCDLESNYKIVPLKSLFIGLKVIPCALDTKTAARSLTFLSNVTGLPVDGPLERGNRSMPLVASDHIDEVRKLLKIEPLA
jgi:hypothetical protein